MSEIVWYDAFEVAHLCIQRNDFQVVSQYSTCILCKYVYHDQIEL